MESTGHVIRDIHKRYTEHELEQLKKAIALLPSLWAPSTGRPL